jgi:hypothetical protein
MTMSKSCSHLGTLLTSLAFAAVSTVFSAPLIAQTQQDLPTTIPNLSGYDGETRRSMELACISDKMNGPVAYIACLNRQTASLHGSPGIPNLRGYDGETRRSMELACISDKMNGPVAYGACLNRQIASLQSSPGIPNLSGYDRETRQSMEIECISDQTNGPVAYGACLNRQIASLQGSPGIPNLSGYDGETRGSMKIACISDKMNGPVAYGACLNRQIASLQGSPGIPNPSGQDSQTRQPALPTSRSGGTNSDTSRSGGTAVHSVNATSRFTTESIMKVHQGMGSNKILEMFGAPKKVSQSVCGASVGKTWTCITWEYGEAPYDWAVFTFSGDAGSLILNNFNVHRK